MTSDFFITYRKQIVITVVALFVLFTVFSLVTYVTRLGKVGVTFSIVPGNAALVIDGQRSGKGTQWLTAGTYDIKVEKEGFETLEKTLIVSEQKGRNVAAISLIPISEDAKRWAEKNQVAYKNNEEFGSIEAQENGQYLRNRHPIIGSLPYIDPYYSIAYKLNDSQSITLTVDTPSPRYRFYAVQKIRELGYNPTDYQIEFKQFTHPLEVAE